MAIKWSPLAVSEVMDKVEAQVGLAESFLQEAHRLAKESLSIPNLPQYMEGRLSNVKMATGGAVERIRDAIDSVRKDLPENELAKDMARADQPSLLDDWAEIK